MTLDEYIGIGERLELGSHTFRADEIKRFAAKFDPQPFHLDEEAARNSVFGRLCASGWHSTSVWMRLNVAARYEIKADNWSGPGPVPVLGPSPGIQDLKWLKPVFVDETITYYRIGLSHRAHPRRPGWRLVLSLAEAFDTGGDKVLEFTSRLLFFVGNPE